MVISATGRADLAALDQEAGGAAAVVAGDRVDALADQLGDQDGAGNGGEQLLAALVPGHQHQVGRARARASADRAAGMAGRRDAELAGVGAGREPAGQHAVGDEVERAAGQAFAVEGAAAQAARTQGSSRMMMPGANSWVPSASWRKLVLRAMALPVTAATKWPSSEATPAGRR
jgi:hypothetical protein